jgi:NADH:ubiquinone oxidoreductase subunit 6 (subunit J)
MNDIKDIPLYLWAVMIIILFTQGCWIFWDASKRGENKWLWGLFGLLNAPSNLIVYLIVTRVVSKSILCRACGKKVRKNYKYCPYCGEKQSTEI